MRTGFKSELGLLAAISAGICSLALGNELSPGIPRESLTHFYELRGNVPLWFIDRQLTVNGHAMLEQLKHAEDRGLQPQDYGAERLEALIAALDAKPSTDSGKLEYLLSSSIARFATDVHSGRVNPRDVGYDLDVPQAQLDVGAALLALATAPDVSAAVSALEPPFRHYRLLKEALVQWPVESEQRRKIELTLERVRWLPAKLDPPPIFVNIPQFKLFAFRTTDDLAQDILQMDVIVGAAFKERETPVFAADMRYIVLRPYWNVPISIMRKEYLPLIFADPGWVDANGYEIVQGQTDSATVMPPTAENIALLSRGVLRLRQKPGPNNALGQVKFMLPNRHNVYLHDTPAQSLFKKSKRAFSHGCIRVSNPMALLSHVLRSDPDWPQDRIDASLASGKTIRIPLREPLRVFMIYGTALATEAGETLFFDDIYNHDKRLAAALDARSTRLSSGER